MKKCLRCGHPWTGFGAVPRSREICEGCGAYLRSCRNCHYFDREITRQCTLPHTRFNGSREDLNFCEEFALFDTRRKANEDRVVRAKATWEALFRR